MKDRIHKSLRLLLAYGTLSFGIVSLVRFQKIAELTRMAEDDVQKMAMRDIGSGIALLTTQGQVAPLIAVAVADFRDGARLLRSQSRFAPVAFVWGLLAIIAIVTRPSGKSEPPAPKAESQAATAL